MPTYDYKCENCENQFEKFLTISRRYEPTEEPCSICNGQVNILPATPLFAYDNVSTGKRKVDREFRDRMIDIKRSHAGSSMNIPP